MLMLLALVVWVVIKTVRKSEGDLNEDVVYQNLQDARQVYHRMMKP